MSESSGMVCSGGSGDPVPVLSSKAKILSFTEGNEEFARQIVGEFLKCTPQLLEDIKKALAQNDLESLKGYCHRVKGNLAYLGEDRIIKIVSKIDCIAPSRNDLHPFFTEMNGMLERLAKEWELPSPFSCGISQSD